MSSCLFGSFRMQWGSVIAAETIRSWKDLPMHVFETRVWEALGRNYIGKEDRRLVIMIILSLSSVILGLV